MNKTYKIIFNSVTGAWVVVSELVASRGKQGKSVLRALLPTCINTVNVFAAGLVLPITLGALLAPTQAIALGLTGGQGLQAPDANGTSTSGALGTGAIASSAQGTVIAPQDDCIAFSSSRLTSTGANVTFMRNLSSQTTQVGGETASHNGLSVTIAGDNGSTSGEAAQTTTSAFGFNSLASGCGSRALGAGSTAIGANNTASLAGSTAIGIANTASGAGSTAMGIYATASGFGSISMGVGANASGDNSIALGTGGDGTAANVTRATAIGAIAIGGGQVKGAQADNTNAIAIGGESAARDVDAIAIGRGAIADSTSNNGDMLAIGAGAQATGQDSTAIGGQTTASGTDAVAIGGNGTQATQTGATVLGYGSNATGTRATALGSLATASAENAVAISNGANSASNNGIAIGAGTITTTGTSNGVAIGGSAASRAENAVALGGSANANAVNALALGSATSVTLNNSVALGSGSAATATTATTNWTTANGVVQGRTLTVNQAPTNGVVAVGNRQIQGVADGEVSATSTNAINGSQLFKITQALPASPMDYRNVNSAEVGNKSNSTGATGAETIAIGGGASASNTRSLAMGFRALASGSESIAIGASGLDGFGATQATGKNAVAIGTSTRALTDNTIAIGFRSGEASTGTSNVAIGQQAGVSMTGNDNVVIGRAAGNNFIGGKVVGDENVLIGRGASAGDSNLNSGGQAVSIGKSTSAKGVSSVAIGENARAETLESVAIGKLAIAEGGKAVSIGSGNTARGNGAVAIGDPSFAIGTGAVVLGADNIASSDGTSTGNAANGAVAIGNTNIAAGQGSVALGNTSRAETAGSIALGDTAIVNSGLAAAGVALGSGASVSASGGVALGQGSVASVAGGAVGYAPSKATTADKAAITATNSSNLGAVSVGTGAAGGNRQIVNVAAGTNDSDAVNVSQLKSLANSTINFTPDNGTTVTRALGDTLKITSGNATGTATTNLLTKTNATGDGIEISFKETPTFKGADMGGQKITSVGAGSTAAGSTDAINGGQLNTAIGSVATKLGGGTSFDPATGQVVGGFTAGGKTYATVGDAISGVADTPLTFAGNSGTNVDRKLGQTFNIKGAATTAGTYSGGNIKTVANGTDGIDIQLADAPVFAGQVKANGFDASGQKIVNVGAGSVAADSTDAINGGQLNTAIGSVATKLGGGTSFDPATGQVVGGFTVGGTTYASVSDAIAGSTSGIANTPMSFIGDSGTKVDRKLGETLKITSGNATGTSTTNLLTKTNAAGDGIEISFKDTPNFQGADMGGQKITSVGAGSTAAGSTDAINGGQLNTAIGSVATKLGGGTSFDPATGQVVGGFTAGGKTYATVGDAISGVADTPLTFAGNSGSNVDRKLGQIFNIKGDATTAGTYSSSNIKTVTNGTDGIQIQIADAPVFIGQVKAFGFDASGQKIVNVGAGSVAADSTDAINGGQLNTAIGSVASKLGGGTSFDPATGQVVGGFTAGGKTYTTVADAISDVGATANKGWNVSTNGGAGTNVAPGATVDISAGSSNLLVSNTGTNIKIDLAQDISLNSVKTGNTTMNNSGVAVGSDVKLGATGLTITGGPSVTTAGIDAGSKVVTNVAAGAVTETSTDAINGSQLYAVKQTAGRGWDMTTKAIGSGVVVGTAVVNIAPGDTATFTAGNNVVMTQVGKEVQVAVNPELKGLTSVAINGGPTLTSTGITMSSGNTLNMSGNSITNVGVATASTDAVNLGQMTTAIAAAKTRYYSVNSAGGGNLNNDGATGADAIASGKDATAIKVNSVAIGKGATSIHEASVALGANSMTGDYVQNKSVNLGGQVYAFAGSGSALSTVSVGTQGAERQLQNVAAGRISANSTDAVNGSQLYATNKAVETLQAGIGGVYETLNYLDGRISNVARDANAGSASAMAMASMPQAWEPNKTITSMGLASYQGESAYSMGVSRMSDNGRVVLNFGATGNTRNKFGMGVGVGIQW